MNLVDKILQEWSWRTKKGYPDLNNPDDLRILKEEFGLDLLNEAENSSFDSIIEDTFKDGIPAVQGQYKLPKETGMFQISPKDAAPFKELFFKAPDKSVGNGEVALYWLFNYANPKAPSDRARENRGADDPDLLVDGRGLEVKSYPSHSKKSTLGKFKSDVESRKIINALFGFTNMTKVLGEEGDFNSEVVFNLNTLRDAFEQVQRVKEILKKDDVQEVLGSYTLFSDLLNQANKLTSLVEGGTPEDLAKKTMIILLKNKISKKPGPGNYIINMLPSEPTNAKIFRIPENIEEGLMEKSFEHLAKNVSINSAEIQFKYDILD